MAGRGRYIIVLTASFLVISSSLIRTTSATSHLVGDSKGWGFSVNYTNWTNMKSFAAGDTLVFNYQSGQHNVVPVGRAGYRSCSATARELVRVESTGNDKMKLKKGDNFFICSIAGHCSSGMKLQVHAK